MQDRHSLTTSPNWTPAFAGVVDMFAAVVLGSGWRADEPRSMRPMFSREGGSPVWVHAFAGKHGEVVIASC